MKTPQLTEGDRTHCEHGTYTGEPGGRDLLCGFCESLCTDDEFHTYWRNKRIRDLLRNRTAPALAKRASDPIFRTRLLRTMKTHLN